MARCSGHIAERCDGTAIGLFRWSTYGEPRALCAVCKDYAERMGMTLVQDRSSWRARAIAKTLPGKVLAA